MIYGILFFEFCKIGLLALGGGLVTVPFLFALCETYPWYTAEELVNMIVVAESSPGPIGVNMATYAGFKAAGIGGAAMATIGLVLPSVIIIVLIAAFWDKIKQTKVFQNLMYGARPAVLALILNAGIKLGELSLNDIKTTGLCIIFLGAIHFIKLHPVIYILVGGILGLVLKL